MGEPALESSQDERPQKVVKRLIIGDLAPVKFDLLIKWLSKEGIETEAVTDPHELLTRLEAASFDVCIVNLLLAGTGPSKLISDIKKRSRNPEVKIVVVSKQVQRVNVENVIRAGAHDFIAEPFENENAYYRVLYHLAPKTVIETLGFEGGDEGEHKEYVRLILQAVETLSRVDRESAHESILEVLQNLASIIGSNRTSLIVVDRETSSGVVLASSDDPNFRDFPINLSKYPEVLHVVNTGTIVLVDDVSRNDLTKGIRDSVRSISIGSIMVFPVRFQSDVIGVLTVRRAKAAELPPMGVLSILQALANVLAAHSNTRMLLRKIYSDFPQKGE